MLRDRVADGQGGEHGAGGIVLVRHRCAEDRDDRIADELLHRPAEALDLLPHARVVGRLEPADVLGIEPLGAAREADEIDEDDGDDLPLLRARGPLLVGERRAAGRAERQLR